MNVLADVICQRTELQRPETGGQGVRGKNPRGRRPEARVSGEVGTTEVCRGRPCACPFHQTPCL